VDALLGRLVGGLLDLLRDALAVGGALVLVAAVLLGARVGLGGPLVLARLRGVLRGLLGGGLGLRDAGGHRLRGALGGIGLLVHLPAHVRLPRPAGRVSQRE